MHNPNDVPAAGKVRAFEDLRVFQEARELVKRVYAETRSGAISRDRALVDQMRRAALSVLSNIAEGFERDSDAEFVRFLYIAKGSSGELRGQVLVALDQKYLTKEVYDDLTACCRRISGSLSNLIAYLKKSSPSKRRT